MSYQQQDIDFYNEINVTLPSIKYDALHDLYEEDVSTNYVQN